MSGNKTEKQQITDEEASIAAGGKKGVNNKPKIYTPAQMKELSAKYGCKFDRQGHLISVGRIPPSLL